LNRPRSTALGLVALITLGTFAPAAAVESEVPPTESLRLPKTIDRVWYRAGKKRTLGGATLSGDLTVTAEALELVGRKKTLTVPMGSIRVVSFGKMRGDVNTDWVVLAVERAGEEEIIGLRDGKKMGYGARTREIYDLVKRTIRTIGAAQYEVPRGLETYDELDHQFTMAIPAGWSSSHLSVVEVDDRVVWGTIVFSAEEIPLGSREPERKRRELEKIDSGDTPSLVIDRREAEGGMRCMGFSDMARRTIGSRVLTLELISGGERWVLDEFDEQWQSLAGCEGLRLVGRGRRNDGTAVVLDARAVSDGETLFVFVLRSVADDYESRLRAFDKVLATFRFSVAHHSP
jgi:hypothetical protein